MALVDYSESENSDTEETTAEKEASKSSLTGAKPAFQRVVDRSNPHKIRVNLPSTSRNGESRDQDEDQPAPKRAKLGAGTYSGFNALLPAPKRSIRTTDGQGAHKSELRSGVSLKTGAAPGFSREPEPVPDANEDKLNQSENIAAGKDEDTVTKDEDPASLAPERQAEDKPKEVQKKKGNPMVFKPLSVAKKIPKKKPTSTNGLTTQTNNSSGRLAQPKEPPKVSLFSAADSKNDDIIQINGDSVYKPIVYEPQSDSTPLNTLTVSNPYLDEEEPMSQGYTPEFSANDVNGSLSLDSIASDLNLSAAAKRQLLGRQRRDQSAVNVINFNTDQEYQANELLRQAGEQVQHNPVRSIAPGKHSLQQLVNAVSNQKDALEEQFASGRRNRREAGSKYGW
ncbi:MAG: hypothetical protein LQ342_007200 [Letrouitia transgressa]|nr:MAG: hypothetical protein LQ342_007200 [Letrouitia transgressa]